MCGIAGRLNYSDSSPIDKGQLLRMRDAMASRGPDGAGLYTSADGRIGLAHRRLSIIDLSEAGAQPMATPDGSLIIVFNGEIYNYREIRKCLEARGYVFQSQCDTEVLLHLYADKGLEMLNDLRGMYAFGLWDAKKLGLLLACDPFGIKPLYYADNGKCIQFASQVKALLHGGGIDTTPDAAGHVGFLLWGSVPQPHTLYKEIRSLEAGSFLWIDEGGSKNSQKFCNVAAELIKTQSQEKLHDSEDLCQHLAVALRDSLACHLIADVPISLFLSSGLDSATLTALATEVTKEQIKTVTLSFKEFTGTSNDETPLAECIAQYYETFHNTIRISRDNFHEEISRLFEVMDQPSIDGVNTYFVSRAARSTGTKVAISGLGGDELFGGYPSFSQIPKMVKALKSFKYLPSVGKGFRWVSAPFLASVTSPKYAGVFEYGSSYSGAYLLRRGLFMPWELPSLLDKDLVRQGWQELQPLFRLEEICKGTTEAQQRISALELSLYMRNQLLRDTDWASMAHSLEVRVPLVDLPLLRSVAALNKFRPVTKRDMASAPKKPLPPQVMNRKKTGFSIPVQQWLFKDSEPQPGEAANRQWAKLVYSKFTGPSS